MRRKSSEHCQWQGSLHKHSDSLYHVWRELCVQNKRRLMQRNCLQGISTYDLNVRCFLLRTETNWQTSRRFLQDSKLSKNTSFPLNTTLTCLSLLKTSSDRFFVQWSHRLSVPLVSNRSLRDKTSLKGNLIESFFCFVPHSPWIIYHLSCQLMWKVIPLNKFNATAHSTFFTMKTLQLED